MKTSLFNGFNLDQLEYCWVGLVLLVLVFCFRRAARINQAKLSTLASQHVLQKTLSGKPRGFELARLFLTGLFLFFAILRPQWGFRWNEGSVERKSIVFAVDISDSMLAKDLQPSRLALVKRYLHDIAPRLRGNRLGLVSFAGDAFVEVPLTIDVPTFIDFAGELVPELSPRQGTNIEAALETALRTIAENPEKRKNSLIVLLSDGEVSSGNTEQALAKAQSQGVKILSLGVGTEQGASIITQQGIKRDEKGEVVLSKLNATTLQSIASATNGAYLKLDPTLQLALNQTVAITETLSATKATERGQIWFEYFQLPLALAILCYLLTPSYARFRSPLLAVLLGLLLLRPTPSLAADQARALGAQAQQALSESRFSEAQALFEQAAKAAPSDARMPLGKGLSLYRQGKFAEAATEFEKSTKLAQSPVQKLDGLYNLGNALTQLGQYKEAIAAYEEGLKTVAEDRETKENLEYVKKLLKEEQKKDRSEEQNQQQQNQQEQNKDKEQQNLGKKEQEQQGKSKEEGEEEKGAKEKEAEEKGPQKKESEQKESEQKASGEKASERKDPADKGDQGESKTDSQPQQEQQQGKDPNQQGSQSKESVQGNPKDPQDGQAQALDQLESILAALDQGGDKQAMIDYRKGLVRGAPQPKIDW
ncbi:VWA domain-containing protein [bacterium]|nr:VWA domain-containing protein [bacterium]